MSGLSISGVQVRLPSGDAQASARSYRDLFGAADVSSLRCGNAAVEFADEGEAARMLLAVDDVDESLRLLGRRGLALSDAGSAWVAEGLPVGVEQSAERTAAQVGEISGVGDITGMDHLVFMCAGRDRGLALFGATLGLDFRLDRQIAPAVRQLFFRAADFVVEVVATDPDENDETDLDGTDPGWPVSLWGLAWRSSDVDCTHERLSAAGLSVTSVKSGRKPGTRIFTVKERGLATRTVVIGPDA